MTRGNWSYMLLAFIMSVSLWYMVVGQERVEQPITLRIEYSGMPADLVIKKGLVQDITIQLRGPKALIRTASESRYTYTVNLSHLKKGINTVPLTTTDLPFTRAFEVVDMTPSRLTLEVDALVEREIGVDVHMREGLAPSIAVKNFAWKPESALVRGPESVVSQIFRLYAEVPPPLDVAPKTVKVLASLVLPELVEAIPAQVEVTYGAVLATKEITLTRTVQHTIDTKSFLVMPQRVSIRAVVPLLEAENEDFLKEINVSIDAPPLDSFLAGHGAVQDSHAGRISDIEGDTSDEMASNAAEDLENTGVSVLDAQKMPVHIHAPATVKVLEITPQFIDVKPHI